MAPLFGCSPMIKMVANNITYSRLVSMLVDARVNDARCVPSLPEIRQPANIRTLYDAHVYFCISLAPSSTTLSPINC